MGLGSLHLSPPTDHCNWRIAVWSCVAVSLIVEISFNAQSSMMVISGWKLPVENKAIWKSANETHLKTGKPKARFHPTTRSSYGSVPLLPVKPLHCWPSCTFKLLHVSQTSQQQQGTTLDEQQSRKMHQLVSYQSIQFSNGIWTYCWSNSVISKHTYNINPYPSQIYKTHDIHKHQI